MLAVQVGEPSGARKRSHQRHPDIRGLQRPLTTQCLDPRRDHRRPHANTVVQVDVSANPRARAKATFVRIGSSRTNAKGRVNLPAFKASQPGSFVIRLKTPAGKAYFLKVKVAGTSSAKPASKPAGKPAA